MKQNRYVILLGIILLLAILWTNRYLQVNRYYDDLTISKVEIYSMGEEVSFENNLIDKGYPAMGYSIRVDDIQVLDQSLVFLADNQKKVPNKVILVTVTIRCTKNDPAPIYLTLFNLFSENMIFGIDGDDLSYLNSQLKNNVSELQLQNGEECQLILPYRAYREDLNNADWKDLEKSVFYFQMCMFPRRIYFRLSA